MPSEPLSILMVDDDSEDLELIGDAIRTVESDARLHMLTSSRSALEYLDSTSELPCLIVLDYNMPEMNGAQLLGTWTRTDSAGSLC